MRKNTQVVCLVIGVMGITASAWAATPGTIATFDVDEDGFVGSTIATVQIHAANGGNPNGFVQIRKDLETGFDIGTQNSVWPGFLGDYAAGGITGAGFDLNVFNIAFDDAQIRLRRNVAENGWHHSFGAVLPNANAWESFDVSFNPAWDDVTAILNGWTQEAGSPSFADLMASVGWLEVRLINEGSAIAGIDNVRLVPEPATLALLALGTAVLGRRRLARN